MKLKITVHGVAYEVDVEVLDAGEGFPPSSSLPPRPAASPAPAGSAPQNAPAAPGREAAPEGDTLHTVASPIAGTIQEIKVKPGDQVQKNQALLVIEAMKMNSSIAAPVAGKVKAVPVAVGDSVREGQTLVEFE